MEALRIRNATETDRADIARMIAEVFRVDFEEAEKDTEKVARALCGAIDPQRFFLAQDSGSTVGILAVSDLSGRALAIHSPQMLADAGLLNEGTAYIEFVAVDEAYRRCGVASFMLRHAIEHAGYTAYTLNVDEDNAPAIACYRKMGFEEFGRVGGGARERICMKRTI